jgi:hypothetical protein
MYLTGAFYVARIYTELFPPSHPELTYWAG